MEKTSEIYNLLKVRGNILMRFSDTNNVRFYLTQTLKTDNLGSCKKSGGRVPQRTDNEILALNHENNLVTKSFLS